MNALRNLSQLILVGLMTLCGLASGASQTPVAVTSAMDSNVLRADSANIAVNRTSAKRGNRLWSIPLASLTATRERPILSPTRRPSSIASKSTSPLMPTTTQPQLSLVGAIAGDDEGIAILMDGFTKMIIRLKTGESYAGWTVQSVRPREVTIQKDQKTAILALPSPPAK
jgi:hypothetical protein